MKTTKFKSSEVGPIPEEWEVKPFAECFTLLRNNTYSRENMTDIPGMVANVHYGDVLIKYGAVLDFANDEVPYLKSSVQPNKDILKNGDLIFADTAEDETAGKAVEVQGVRPRMAVAGLHTVACRPNEGIFAPRYLGYYINSAAYHNQLLPLMTGTKVTSVSRAGFASTYVAIPPKSEQERIAEALSDMDALLSAMTTLIEKKRAIKQGAMQQLLTGKKRLAGFTGPWVEKRLGDVLEIGNGKDYKHLGQGSIPVYGTGGLMTYVDEYLYDGPTVCIGRKGTIDQPQYHEGRIWTVDTLFYTYNFNGTNSKYLYYLFTQIDWLSYNTATGVPSLTAKSIADIVVRLPEIAEQEAIAAVLSDMDAEIVALEAKRAKYESIKQGMMQELLTGKTRLV